MTDSLDGLPKQASGTQLKWWQWVLMYPTLAISLLGSVPTASQLYSSQRLKVPFERVPAAKRQNELWATNFECARNAKTEAVTNGLNTQVSATVCPSGDVLVAVQPPDSSPVLRWIDVKALVQQSPQVAGLLLGEALAANDRIVVAQAKSVLCQRWLVNGRLMRRVTDEKGNCFDEVVNTYTGVLESRVPAQCSNSC